MQPDPFFRDPSGVIRFQVAGDNGECVNASVEALSQSRFNAYMSRADAVAVYIARREEIDAAMRRRLSRSSIEPVMLREADMAVAPGRP